MENKHIYKQWENRKPRCEDFGFSEKDIPRIHKAEERFRNISSFVPSDELESLKKRQKELKANSDLEKRELPKKKDWSVGFSFLVIIGVTVAIITKGFTDYSMGLIGIIAMVLVIVIAFGIPLTLAMHIFFERTFKFLDSIINKEFYKADKQVANQKKQLKDQEKELENQIIKLEIEEAERHRKYIQTVFGEDYALSANLNNYYKALDYYNSCRDAKRSEYWDKFQGGDGNDFERACAKFLSDRGFYARVTPIGPDKGVDIFAERDGYEYACQCKALGGKVSSGDIQKFIGVLVTGPYKEGFFFSLNGFSLNALEVAYTSPKKIYCLSKKELMEGKIR